MGRVTAPSSRWHRQPFVHVPYSPLEVCGAATVIRTYPEPTGLRVVLAAANPITALQMGVLLGMDGHDVRLAHDGASALEATEAHDPDVLLLEGGLPGLDVHEVARRLK